MITDTVQLREGDRLFARIYVERTTYRWRESDSEPTRFANLLTEAWFHDGVVILRLIATAGGDRPFFEGDHDPTGTTIVNKIAKSAAIRLAITAHDRAHADLRAGVPEKAQRES